MISCRNNRPWPVLSEILSYVDYKCIKAVERYFNKNEIVIGLNYTNANSAFYF